MATKTRSFTIIIPQSQSDKRQAAMLAQGLDPRAMSMGRGTQWQRDRKKSLQRGEFKHRGRALD
jgi:hypothetical protein